MTNKLFLKRITLLTLFSALFLSLSNCGNVSEKQDSALADSVLAIEQWNETIPGNFSPQEVFYFDSLVIDSFLIEHSQFNNQDSNISKFYTNRNYSYAWFDDKGLIEQAGNLVDRVSNLKKEGLFSEPVYKKELDSLLLEHSARAENTKPNIMLELMLTAQYFEFAQTVWQGLDTKASEASAWFLPRKKISYEAYLDSLLTLPPDQERSLQEPIYRQYELLKSFLQKYRTLDSTLTFSTLKMEQRSYKVGDSTALIPKIKTRLYHLDDFKGDTSTLLFDENLVEAVKSFQTRHGLTVDGTIGNGTMQELNIPLKNRVRQLIVNMERSRWVPISLNKEYLAVNIPEFKLHIYRNDSLLWSTNVVVGKNIHKTVVFSGDVKYVVFSPYWNIPTSIVRNEVMPGMARNANYIRQHNMEITGYNGKIPMVRQKPGPTNSLGLVKFLFPNSHSIYLHDSPAKSLFNESARAFSHGCVRVQEPKRLAEFLLKGDSSWNDASITAAMNRGVEKTVTLRDPVPVFISYFTAFVDRDKKINFRKDIYNRDERLAEMIIEEKAN